MKKGIIIGFIVLCIFAILLCALNRYFVLSFKHMDADKIDFQTIDLEELERSYDLNYYKEKSKCSEGFCRVYHSALIDFPDQKLFIEENLLFSKRVSGSEDVTTYSILYVDPSLQKGEEETYIDDYVDVMHGRLCGVDIDYYLSIDKDYYFIKYTIIDEC